MLLFGALSILVGWVGAVALVVMIRTLVEYPVLQVAELGAGAPMPPSVLWVRIAYGSLAAGVAGFVTGWLAPRAPLRHALVLAVLVGAPALLYALPDRSAEPAGHDPATVALPVLAVLAGAWLRGRIGRRGGGK